MEASLAAVSAGLAYAWLPEHIVNPALAHGELKALPLTSGATRKVPLYLVLVRPEIAGPAARAAIECFKRSKP
jgi:DNA-binding transcriptional LysR family regulator